MKKKKNTSTERVVKLTEMCDGAVVRTFYGIYDAEFAHWMSDEPFEGAIWTKDPKHRREFNSRDDAKFEFRAFLDWRAEQMGDPEECA